MLKIPRKERPQLQKMTDLLRTGDIVIVWKSDRLGRSLKELLERVNGFQQRGIGGAAQAL